MSFDVSHLNLQDSASKFLNSESVKNVHESLLKDPSKVFESSTYKPISDTVTTNLNNTINSNLSRAGHELTKLHPPGPLTLPPNPYAIKFPPIRSIDVTLDGKKLLNPLTFNPKHKGEKIFPHSYGDFPTLKGAINFIKDSKIKEAEPIIKEVLLQEELLTGRKGEFFIRLLSPVLLLIAVLATFYAVYIAIKSASNYGMQVKTVDDIGPTNTVFDVTKYYHTAKTTPAYQVFALRGGFNGQQYNMTLTVPNAAEMTDGAVIVARNCSITFNNTNDNKNGEPKSAKVIIPELNYTIDLPKRRSKTLISLKDSAGVARWYDPILGNE